ncbi:MAG: methyltransferase [Rhodospirillales bacterium]|nr:methyltransferase [Rhodospirillales bacterium]
MTIESPVEIHVLDKKVRLLQPAQGFRTSLDSVMLAAACPVQDGQSVLDMGCGVGGAAFCVLQRLSGAHVTGVDVQADYVALAQRNIELNGAQVLAEFVCADIRDFKPDRRFDHVICNPPFMEAGHHTPSPHEGRALANGHVDICHSEHCEESEAAAQDPSLTLRMTLKDWLDAGFHNLKSGGSLTMIHRADMTDKIIQGLGRRFGAVEIIPLWPRAGQAAKRVIIRAIKDRKSPAALHPGLVLHEGNGDYTAAADSVLRDGSGI